MVVFVLVLVGYDDRAYSRDRKDEKGKQEIIMRAIGLVKRGSKVLDKDMGGHALSPEIRLHLLDRFAADGDVFVRHFPD